MEFSWAAQKSRTTCAQISAARALRAEVTAPKPREQGRFKKTGVSVELPPRAPPERAERREEVIQARFDKYIENTRIAIAAQDKKHCEALQNLQNLVDKKNSELKSLRNRLRLTGAAQRILKPRPLQGGTSAPTQRRLITELDSFLNTKYATVATRKQAIFEHYQRNPALYLEVTTTGITLTAFNKICAENPEWVHFIRREVITQIEEFWSAEKCLSLQIHCKFGAGEKYQHLINISAEDYSEEKREWVHKELFEKGSGVFLPKFKSKNQVTGLRREIAEVIPLIQDEAGIACWLELRAVVEEGLRDERKNGYLQSEVDQLVMHAWLHWGGDAAGILRGIKHSKFGFKFVGNGQVCAQAPQNMTCILLFEGKDNYNNYKELMAPFLPVMKDLKELGVDLGGVHFHIKQTMGADYVLLAEVLGHGGHSCTQGCCFCKIHKKNYGTIVIDESGRRVPMPTEARTLEEMAAAAHRPLTVGPDIKCPFCDEPFPDQAAVDASVGPQTNAQRTAYQLKHAGQKFGCPPLFDFALVLLYLSILHTLLRLVAVVF
jgi:hypothetical protein